jgi:hypothetical protein
MAAKAMLVVAATLACGAMGAPQLSNLALARLVSPNSNSTSIDDVTKAMDAQIKALMTGKSAFGATPMVAQ